MQWGPHLKALQQRAKKTGRTPPALLRLPKLKRFDGEFIEAFYTLSRSRQHGVGGPNPISVQEVLAYCVLVGIDGPSERLKYLSILQRLDGVYLDYHAAQADKNKKPS